MVVVGARTRQIDRNGRRTIKRGHKAKSSEGAPCQAAAEIAVPLDWQDAAARFSAST